MKPIGILTFHRASNYGAVLQAYALQNVFDDCGREAVIVDYRCRTVEEGHRPWGMFKRHKFPIVLFRCCVALKKDSLFGAFRKNRLKISAPADAEELQRRKGDYVLFVAGSDQVWNNKLSGMDPTYMLTFADDCQRYSYACSLGFDSFPEGTKDLYREWLSGMQCISLRESRATGLIESIGYKARSDLDPTLILGKEKWEAFLTPADRSEPYILVYTVDGDINLLKAARKLSERTGVSILYLNNEYKNNRDIERARYRTPEEFVGLFAGAEYVFTNSFHGTAFSIIFHRKFKVELETVKKFNVRSRDLLADCGLQQCILKNSEEDYRFCTDWEEPDRLLGAMRERSLAYIRLIAARADELEREQ